jgi:integrase
MKVRYLQLGYKNTFYFRLRVPDDLRHMLKCSMIRRSLKTTDEAEAVVKAHCLAIKCQQHFEELRNSEAESILSYQLPQITLQRLKSALFPTKTPAVAKFEQSAPSTPTAPEVQLPAPQVKKPVILGSHEAIERAPAVSRKISECLAQFIDDKRIANKSERYAVAIQDAVSNLIEFTGDIDAALIDKGLARQFVKTYANWPSNRRKKPEYRDLSIQEIMQLDVPESDKISETTYNNNIRKLSTFMLWLHDEGVIKTGNPFSDFFKKEKAAKDQWAAFTREDIQSILRAQASQTDLERPSRFWIPWMLSHCGARVEEICALYKDDIELDPATNIWFMNIQNNREDKHIKNRQSERELPIHSRLLQLGFITYVERLPDNTRLFPDLTYKSDYGYHEKISRHFSRHLRRIRIIEKPGEKKTLKSFRHSVTTELYNRGVAAGLVEEIVGHVPSARSMSLSRYHKGYNLAPKRDALEMIDWNVGD